MNTHRRKRFGQHFLSDPRILARIADALGATATDTVVEIGPGRGALTAALLQRAGRVLAIEVDHALAALLVSQFEGNARLTVLDADVLKVDVGALAGGPFLLAGNIPYNITTPIIFNALVSPRPTRAVFLMQMEVAERIAAPAGSESYGALSVNVQAFAAAEVLFRVAPGSFSPPPAVDSAVIRLQPFSTPLITPPEEREFRAMVVAAFGMRRKQMQRVARSLWNVGAEASREMLRRAEIDPMVRPETLSAADFVRLLRARAAAQ